MKDKKLLAEMSWGDEPEVEQEEENNASDDAVSAFDNISFLNRLDKQFNDVYSNVTKNNTGDLQLFSSKMQKVELSNFAKTVSKKINPERDEIEKEINKLLGTGHNDILKVFDDTAVHSNRKKLYELYSEIANINNIAYRMLQVYLNNILIKNGQNKQFVNVIDNDMNKYVQAIPDEVKDNIKKFIKTVLIFFDFQSKLKNKIVPETLKFGDTYLEIVDLEPVDTIIGGRISVLTESVENVIDDNPRRKTNIANLALFEDCTNLARDSREEIIEMSEDQPVKSNDFNTKMAELLQNKISKSFIIEENDLMFWNDVTGEEGLNDREFELEDFANLSFDGLNDIYLRFVPPSNVLKIEKDGNLYGYLIIEDLGDGEMDTSSEIDMYQRFLSDDGDGSTTKNSNYQKQEEKLADALVSSISNKLAEIITKDSGFLSDMPEELESSLRIIAYEKNTPKIKTKI
jgi:hypothetical protein